VRAGAGALLLALVLALPAAGATPTGGTLVFASNRRPELHGPTLYVFVPSTRHLQLLTPAGMNDEDAAWMPDGRTVVVARSPGVDPRGDAYPSHLLRIRAGDGRVLRTLTAGSGESCPLPSPDGRWLAFCRDGRLWIAHGDGSGAVALPQAGARGVVWSPDARQLAIGPAERALDNVAGQFPRPGLLRIVDRTGRVVRALGYGILLAWARPGELSVVRGTNSGHDRVEVVRPATGTVIRRTAGPAVAELKLGALRPKGSRARLCRTVDTEISMCMPDGSERLLVPFAHVADPFLSALAWAPDGRRLLYSLAVSVSDADIYEASPGSSTARRLVGTWADEGQPALSPDATRLAFVRFPRWSDRARPSHVFVKELPDGPIRVVGQGASPAWSPDGRTLLFATGKGLAVLRDGRPGILARGTFGGASWSPDGTTIVAAQVRDNHSMLVTLPAAGGTPRPLGLDGSDPAWSPDGTRIAYSANGVLWLAAADGSGPRQLTRIGEDASSQTNVDVHPSWSPDGSWIAYASGLSLDDAVHTGVHGIAEQPEPFSVLAVTPDGAAAGPLVFDPPWSGADFDPSWHS
jgi:Tol biopolymer transport system component